MNGNMNKYFLSVFFFLIIITLLSFNAGAPVQQVIQQQKLRTIIIDAGHGLPDPGAQGEYSNESDITLAIAMDLGKKLQQSLPDCKIVYTRTTRELPNGLKDKNVANRYRAQMANENHGDLFIAIHVNDAPHPYEKRLEGYRQQTYYTGKGKSRKKHTRTVPVYKYYKLPGIVNGTETYVWAVGKNDSKQSFVNSNEQEMYGEKADSSFQYFDSPEAKILASLRTQKYFSNSLLVADYVEDEFAKTGRVSHGVKQRDWEGIWVLQATAMPSILVETGFICTPTEEEYLNSDKGRDEVSNCILNAVLRYKQHLENGADTTATE